MKVTLNPSPKTFIQFWLVPVVLLLIGLAVYSARTALIIIGSAFFLALALNKPVSRLARHVPGRSRVLSTAMAYTVVVALIGAFIFLAVPPIIQQTAKFAQTLPALVDDARDKSRGFNNIIEEYQLQPQVDQALDSVKDSTGTWASSVGKNVVSGIGSLVSFTTALILVLVLSFLMLVEGPTWMKRIWGLYEDHERMEYHREVTQRMHSVVSNYVSGQLIVSALSAVSAGLVVFILSFIFDVPNNLAIPTAAITFILSLIPMFGSTIGGVLVALLLVFNDPAAAITYFIFFVVYQQIENNYISPTIQSKQLQLSALAVLIAVTIGLYLFGVAGGIISIPIAGSIKVLVDAYLEQAQKKRQKSKSPLRKIAKKV